MSTDMWLGWIGLVILDTKISAGRKSVETFFLMRDDDMSESEDSMQASDNWWWKDEIR